MKFNFCLDTEFIFISVKFNLAYLARVEFNNQVNEIQFRLGWIQLNINEIQFCLGRIQFYESEIKFSLGRI